MNCFWIILVLVLLIIILVLVVLVYNYLMKRMDIYNYIIDVIIESGSGSGDSVFIWVNFNWFNKIRGIVFVVFGMEFKLFVLFSYVISFKIGVVVVIMEW